MASVNFNLGYVLEDVPQTFKFKDIGVPIRKEASEFDIVALFDRAAVVNSLGNIFDWRKGERILNHEFGNPIIPYIYEPINDITARNIGREIRQAIAKWEPRVRVEDIFVEPNPDQNEYYVSITYSIPSLDVTGNNFELNISIT
jgi:phage baseplate assembly protein W